MWTPITLRLPSLLVSPMHTRLPVRAAQPCTSPRGHARTCRGHPDTQGGTVPSGNLFLSPLTSPGEWQPAGIGQSLSAAAWVKVLHSKGCSNKKKIPVGLCNYGLCSIRTADAQAEASSGATGPEDPLTLQHQTICVYIKLGKHLPGTGLNAQKLSRICTWFCHQTLPQKQIHPKSVKEKVSG